MDLANYYKTKLNIYLLLFILDKCKEVTEEQSENISLILTTLLLLKSDKSKEVKEEQPKNISLILFNNFLISIF